METNRPLGSGMHLEWLSDLVTHYPDNLATAENHRNPVSLRPWHFLIDKKRVELFLPWSAVGVKAVTRLTETDS